ncbi:MAG: L-seryl-tRNA(Sec) selenium transferase, partial [Candidatus Binatia bacterium]
MKGRETSARRGEVVRPVLRASGAAPDLSQLPSVDAVLGGPAAADLAPWSRDAAVHAVRDAIGELRDRLRRGEVVEREAMDPTAVGAAATRILRSSSRPHLKRVVNATGVVLHTNLGRACLAESAIQAVVEVARGACNLEYDLDTGARGHRDSLVEEHLCALTGAEAATVVNNNAAAVVLALAALAEGREVVVSRGELVEIGGSFRIPEIMAAAGATLREVGTTNRTHLA